MYRHSAKSDDEFTLSVVYKKKATHHVVKAPADGNVTLNKKDYGGHATVSGSAFRFQKMAPSTRPNCSNFNAFDPYVNALSLVSSPEKANRAAVQLHFQIFDINCCAGRQEN